MDLHLDSSFREVRVTIQPMQYLSSSFSSQQKKSSIPVEFKELCMQLFTLVNKKFKVLLLFFLLTIFHFTLLFCVTSCLFSPGDTEIRDTQALRSLVRWSQFTHFEPTF